jgi:hypothetical protein
MSDLLQSHQFNNVQRYNWKEFLPKDFDDYSKSYLPHCEFETGTLMSLNITATK